MNILYALFVVFELWAIGLILWSNHMAVRFNHLSCAVQRTSMKDEAIHAVLYHAMEKMMHDTDFSWRALNPLHWSRTWGRDYILHAALEDRALRPVALTGSGRKV